MAKVNAQEYTEKWQRRLKGSNEDIRRGVSRVSEAPGVAAARQADLMLAKVTEAVASGRWAAKVSEVGLDEWKKKTLEKGLGRIASGVDAAAASQVAMATKLLADVDAAVAMANQTPRGTLEDNITRMTTFVREMAKTKLTS